MPLRLQWQNIQITYLHLTFEVRIYCTIFEYECTSLQIWKFEENYCLCHSSHGSADLYIEIFEVTQRILNKERRAHLPTLPPTLCYE